jgi:hypothetical protein
VAFQVRWQDNNIEWYTENPAFDGVSKIHNLKIKFSPNTVVIPKFWTGLKNCIEV